MKTRNKARIKAKRAKRRALITAANSSIPYDLNAHGIEQEIQRDKALAKVKSFTGGEATEHPREIEYEALFGYRPMPLLLACNRVEVRAIINTVTSALYAKTRLTNMQIGTRVLRVMRHKPSMLELDVRWLRQQAKVKAEPKVSTISALHFVDRPSLEDPDGFEFESQVRTIIFGANAEASIKKLKAPAFGSYPVAEPIEWLELHEEKECKNIIRQAVKSVLMQPLANMKIDEVEGDPAWLKRWKWKGTPEHLLLCKSVHSFL